MNLNKGLVGCWSADDRDTDSNMLRDSSGNDNHGSLEGSLETGREGVVGEAYGFDGENDYVDVPHSSSLSVNFVTMSAWVYYEGGSSRMIMNKENSYEYRIHSDGEVEWALRTDGDWTWRSTGVFVSQDQWTHLTLTYDGDEVILYKNGQPVYNWADYSGALDESDQGLRIGARGAPDSANGHFKGKIDSARIYKRALSEREVKKLYNLRVQTRNSSNLVEGLVGHWPMDLGSKIIETEKGRVTIDSEGEVVVEGLGFRPDYVEFVVHQQIEDVPTEIITPQNEHCPENVNGWTRGAAIFNSGEVSKQMSLTAARNSDSTNHRRVASSSDYVSNQMYVDRNGYICGRMRAEVVDARDDGFVLNIDEKYVYDETIFFNAYKLGFGADVEIGYFEVSGNGEYSADLGFKPDYVEFVTGQEIHEMDYEARGGDRYNGLSFGMVDTDDLTDQYSLSYGAHAGSTSNNRRASSSEYPVNILYDVEQDLEGRLRGSISELTHKGFNFQVSDYHVDELVMYKAFDLSLADVEVGYEKFTGTGSYRADLGFELEDLKLFTQNKIHEMDFEEAESGSSSCGGGGEIGYTTGFAQNEDDGVEQLSVSTGRNSGSMNAHIHASSDNRALNAIYTHRDGQFCGYLTADITDIDSDGFAFDVSNHWADEVTLYRAFSKTREVKDKSAHDNYGLTVGKPQELAGDIGAGESALDFNGENQGVEIPGEYANDKVSMAIWINTGDLDDSDYCFGLHRSGSSRYSFIFQNNSGNPVFWARDENWPDSDILEVNLEDWKVGQWEHLAVTWDQGSIKIYRNGEEVASSNELEGSIRRDSDHRLSVAYDVGDTGRHADLKAGDFRFYNRVLSEEEIRAIYNTWNNQTWHIS